MSELHPLTGDASRAKAIVDEQPIGPFAGRVRVTPIEGMRRGRQTTRPSDTDFEVRVEWTGPGLPGLDATSRGEVVDACDTWNDHELERAKALAQLAIAELRAGRVPELAELYKRLPRVRLLKQIADRRP